MTLWKLASLTLTVALSATFACNSSSGGAPSCIDPDGGMAACTTCRSLNCSSEIATVEDSCASYVSCYEACECSNQTCVDDCYAAATSACQATVSQQIDACTMCASECGTSGSSITTKGGSGSH